MGAYNSLKGYITMNFDGLKDAVKIMLGGQRVKVNVMSFENDMDECHMKNTSILNYNNENALASCIMLAYYTARKNYSIVRELSAGYGYADLVFVPKRGYDAPAMIIELKWDKSAETAIQQIKRKKYIKGLDGYHGTVLLVGISYEKAAKGENNKKHSCVIEQILI